MWRCLSLGVQAGQLEAHAVPGAAPELGLAPGCGEAWPGPLRSACHSPRTGRTAGPGNGSAPAQRGPGWGPTPRPSSRPHTHIGPPAGDWLGASSWGGTGKRLWLFYSPRNILRTGPWKSREEGSGLLPCCSAQGQRGPLAARSAPPPASLLPAMASSWSSLSSPWPVPRTPSLTQSARLT